MEIDDIIEILSFGTEEEIKNILKKGIKYSFSATGEYTIINTKKSEGCRGHGIKNPNCVKYFGYEYK